MAIVNRDKDASEQRYRFEANLLGTPSGVSAGIFNPGVVTSSTFVLCEIPFPASLVTINEAAFGISGAPNHQFWLYRFAGGFTSIQVGASGAPLAYGTSGAFGYTVTAAAASFPFLAGDLVVMSTTGANTAFLSSTVTVVVKALQDIVSDFGV